MNNDNSHTEAEGVGQRLNLNALPAPPPGYRFLGYKTLAQASTRRAQKADLIRWCEFYLWGYDINLGNGRKVDLERGLRKLMYYTAPRHLPQSFAEFDDCLRDAGPRLFDYTRIPWQQATEAQIRDNGLWYSPVSRLFPNPPNPHARTQGGYLRPADAPQPWSDLWVEQALAPSEPKSNTTNEATGSFVNAASKIAKENSLAQGARQEVQEAIQRAMIKIAYSDLDRHPSAAAREAPQHMIAATEHDLIQAIMTSSRATSQVRLSEDDNGQLFISRGGQLWSIKGRGPTYSKDSAIIDCVITIGSLLEAGSTNADRKDPQWHTQSSLLQQAFIELCDVNWDLCGRDSGAQMKDFFRTLIEKENAEFTDREPESLEILWNAVAKGLGQFTLNYDELMSFCDCLETAPTHKQFSSSVIEPYVNSNPFIESIGIKMEDLFDRSFKGVENFKCALCQKFCARLEKNFQSLPLRLAVKTQDGIPIHEHTQNITVKYRRAGPVAQDDSATYRWLGGVYRNGNAYRVYWRTAKRGEELNDQVSMYDSKNHGLIVARSPKTQLDKVVPEGWIPALIFYERVLNPSADVLSEALATVSSMWSDENKGVLTLNNTTPWAPSEQAKPPVSGYPWKPQQIAKPPDAQRFQLVSGAYVPGKYQSETPEIPESMKPKPLTKDRKRGASWIRDSSDKMEASAGAYDDLMRLYSPPPPGEEEREESGSPDSDYGKRRKIDFGYTTAGRIKEGNISRSQTDEPSDMAMVLASESYGSAGEGEREESKSPDSDYDKRRKIDFGYTTAGRIKEVNLSRNQTDGPADMAMVLASESYGSAGEGEAYPDLIMATSEAAELIDTELNGYKQDHEPDDEEEEEEEEEDEDAPQHTHDTAANLDIDMIASAARPSLNEDDDDDQLGTDLAEAEAYLREEVAMDLSGHVHLSHFSNNEETESEDEIEAAQQPIMGTELVLAEEGVTPDEEMAIDGSERDVPPENGDAEEADEHDMIVAREADERAKQFESASESGDDQETEEPLGSDLAAAESKFIAAREANERAGQLESESESGDDQLKEAAEQQQQQQQEVVVVDGYPQYTEQKTGAASEATMVTAASHFSFDELEKPGAPTARTAASRASAGEVQRTGAPTAADSDMSMEDRFSYHSAASHATASRPAASRRTASRKHTQNSAQM